VTPRRSFPTCGVSSQTTNANHIAQAVEAKARLEQEKAEYAISQGKGMFPSNCC
jgi:hypothetical protein